MQLTDVRPNYGRIDFEGLPNTRDLGGLLGAEGRCVRRGLLLRSGTLYFATSADCERLQEDYHLQAVVDLRGDDELVEYPDGMGRLPGVRYVHADALKGTVAGISQNAEARAQLEAARANNDDPASFMEMVYPHILLGESGIAAYRALLRTILETTDGAVLWHCHFGRDRCGMASMLVEAVLGVPMAAMEEDYLATNRFNPDPADERTDANLRFIRAAVAAVTREFGGVDGYVRDALGITDAEVAELRSRYLEPAAS
ncbi:tyrosine-protein phosphatase [Thermophilibacter provencensis]|uniref:Tyrosine-protein phosphatase n=1 Tax=Thermophilibacter provencensis TaxID=1852386 RepID=A0ABT7V4K9_9ACTN|nr:tyrosine-protein phosphatase [Thermophilibacter provencensis]MDM8271535.1 tyrosine-protein phosphatase [Thermophilibacter provencensis]